MIQDRLSLCIQIVKFYYLWHNSYMSDKFYRHQIAKHGIQIVSIFKYVNDIRFN